MGGAQTAAATYKLVTDASTLKDGDVIVIGNEANKAVMGAQNANNRKKETATFSNGILTSSGDVAEIKLVKVSDNSWMLNTADGYLYAASSGSNYLRSDKSKTSADKNAVATISISGNNATIKFTGNYTRNQIKYNSSNSLFSCYASGQQAIQIYKKEEKGEDPQISFSESTVTVGMSKETIDLQTLVNPNNLEVTYSTSDDNIAGVDDGTIYLFGLGTVKIYADTKATDVYKAGHAEYTLNIIDDRQESGIAFDNESYTAGISDGTFDAAAHLVNTNNLKVVYTITPSSDDVVIDENGYALVSKIGTYTITADFAGNDTYKPATTTCTLNVIDDRQEAAIAFDNDSYTADIANAESFYSAEHLANPNKLSVKYEINPTTNAIDAGTGEVLLTKIGTYTITATFAGDKSFKPATTTCTLNVINSDVDERTVEFVAGTDKGTGVYQQSGDIDKDVVSIHSTNAAFTSSPYKLYGGSETTISIAKGNIVKIEFVGTGSNASLAKLEANTGSYKAQSSSSSTWTGSANSVTFNNTDAKQIQIKDIKVYVEIPAVKDFTYSETSANTIKAYENANVTLERTLYNDGWNTFCVPFDVAKEQVTEVFGEGTQIMTLDEKASSGKTVKFVSAESISAHTPCLVWPATAGNSYTFNGVAVESGEPEIVTGGEIMFTGIYSPTDVTDGGSLPAAGLSANNKIVKMKTGGELKAFRAYFVLPDDVSASSYMVDINGTATAIDKIHVDGQLDATAPVYNLQGQRVNNTQLPSGIYVQNGRKIVK